VRLGQAVDDDRLLLHLLADVGHVGKRKAVVHHLLVDVVAHDDDVLAPEHLREGLQLIEGVGRARRVRGAVEDEGLGPRGDGLPELFRRQLEAFRLRGVDDDGRGVGQQHDVRVGYPVGRRDDHLVAPSEEDLGHVVQGVLRPGGHDDLGSPVGEAVVPAELFDDGVLELVDAADRGVLREPLLDGADGGGLDVVGRVEIGLPRAEADDVAPLLLEGLGLHRHRQRGRRPQHFRQGSELHGAYLLADGVGYFS